MTAPQVPVLVDPSFGEAGPSAAEMAGRLIAVIPTGVDHDAAGFEPGTTKTAVTFDVYVIDGGPLIYGAAPKKSRPAQFQIQTPAFFRGQVLSNDNIVRALAPHVGKGVAVMGRIVESTVGSKGNKPWNLEALAQNDPGRALVAQFFGALASGQYVLPEPVALAQPAAPAQPQFQPPQFGAPQQSAPQFAPPMQQPVQVPQQQYAPQYLAPAQPQYLTAQQSYAAAPQQQAPVVEQLPPGMTAEFWATLSDVQKQMMMAQAAQQQGGNQAGQPSGF